MNKVILKTRLTLIQSSKHPQSGAVLVVSLLILLVMTVIGVTGSRSTVLEERMAGNMRDKELSFQAAEAALREGEKWVEPFASAPEPVADCTSPPCDLWTADSTAIDDLESKNLTFWQTQGTTFGSAGIQEFSDAAVDPLYIVEEFYESPGSLVKGKGKSVSIRKVYRVTSIGVGGLNTTQTILQSNYAKEYFGH